MDSSIPRQVLTLLGTRCEAYHDWEVAFRSVLIAVKNPTAASNFFQQTTGAVAHKISTVSLALRNQVLPKLAEIVENNNNSNGINQQSTKEAKLLSKLIEEIQKTEKLKFESTVAMQKLVMNHMRGENCTEFVHRLDCAVFNFCFSFIGGSTLAKVTASASVLTRRRVEDGDDPEHQTKSNKVKQIDVSSSDDDGNDEKKKDQEAEKKNEEKIVKDDCEEVSTMLLELLGKIQKCEETISDATNEIQAIVSDSL